MGPIGDFNWYGETWSNYQYSAMPVGNVGGVWIEYGKTCSYANAMVGFGQVGISTCTDHWALGVNSKYIDGYHCGGATRWCYKLLRSAANLGVAPGPFVAPDTYSELASGRDHVCSYRRVDGSIECWGEMLGINRAPWVVQ